MFLFKVILRACTLHPHEPLPGLLKVANREEFYGLSAAGSVRLTPHTVKDVAYPLSLRNERAALMVLREQVRPRQTGATVRLPKDA
jgi:hypothetical protein